MCFVTAVLGQKGERERMGDNAHTSERSLSTSSGFEPLDQLLG